MNHLLLLLLLAVTSVAHAGPVRELKLAKTYGQTAATFDAAVNMAGITNGVGPFLKQTVDACRQQAAKDGQSPSSIGSAAGHWFEWATIMALREKKLTPIYWQAEFAAVPKNYNDVLLWSKEHGPVVISCKTSLRERYKQADLEAVALRQQYPKAKFFLLTLDEDKRHVATIRKKITGNELLALHALYDETNADELFVFLKTLTLTDPPDKVLHSGTVVR